MIAFLRGTLRFFIFFFSAWWVLIRYFFYRLTKGRNIHHALDIRRKWLQYLLKRLGVRTDFRGEPPTEPSLLVGNHRSYLDPMPLLTQLLAFPVVKAEVTKWPLVGYGTAETGVIWVKRSSKDSRKETREAMKEMIHTTGHHILIFPEGTTHKQPTTIDIRPGAFVIAASENIPVVPFVIEYKNPNVAWVGKDTFLPHFVRTFGKKYTEATLWYGPSLRSDDPEKLRTETKAWIDQHLLRVQKEYGIDLHTETV